MTEARSFGPADDVGPVLRTGRYRRATIDALLALRTVRVTRYVTPLREGGSLPAIVEADDDGTYVLKFRGAGQGTRALIAELVSGELARVLGLPVPEIVFAEVDPRMAKTEPDPEIQDLLRRSEGLNLALDYLPGSITFDPLVPKQVEEQTRLAAKIEIGRASGRGRVGARRCAGGGGRETRRGHTRRPA